MVFLFRDKSIVNIFFLLLLSMAVHLHGFMQVPTLIADNDDGLFSLLLNQYVAGLPPGFLFILYHASLLIQAIRLNMVLVDLRMYHHNTYTAAMTYILLSGILTQWCSISAALLANFLLIWIFIKLSKLYNHPSPKTLLFNTGLIVGISVISYHPTALFILMILFALAVVRPFRLAEWLILLMGVLLPYYFVVSGLFLTDRMEFLQTLLPVPRPGLPMRQWNLPLVVGLSYLTLSLFLGLYYWQHGINRMVIQIRKNWGVMMVMLFIVLLIPFVFYHAGIESGVMSLVPLAAFVSCLFSYPRQLAVPNLLFWLAVAVIVYNNWLLLKN